ncbi:methyl-accepting chemotaxis protein [Sulfuriferula nivalis]|uniref:Methyl-accepting chemotaxis protein n=1 Tax=Sulfuriferula nivalis TaxID=2675298 RepID=A0A809SB94_9PROT|nr:methyl-accepting chemotaxis protein [Sulfuriferula nivalis]BBP02142.1 methyl-accepting chemotaxis protein [Sulfuriferula nivalis]
MLNNLTIKNKLIATVGYLAVSMLIMGYMGVHFLGVANESTKDIYADKVNKIAALDKTIRLMNRNQSLIAQTIIGKISTFPDDNATTQRRITEISDTIAAVSTLQDDLLARTWSTSEQSTLEELKAARKKYGSEGVGPALAALKVADYQQAMEILQGPLHDNFIKLAESFDTLSQSQLAATKLTYEQGQSRFHMVQIFTALLMLGGLIISSLLAWWLIHSITRPLGLAVTAAERIAAGDLSQDIPVTSNDELGELMQAMQTMQSGLNEIVTHVRQGTETIASAAQEIAVGNTDLSNRTESQAHSLTMTATETAQMAKMVEETTEHAHHAQKVAATTRDMCESGGETMAKVVSTMSEISSSSRKIVDIISVIEGIAFQTNILALNAAVEAARAGEQGRGFAVVAGEVRSLAQRSAAAAKEIKTLITESVHKVKDGTQLVEEAGDNMDEILTVVGMFTDLLDSIYEASTQQNSGISTINRSVSEMDETTQQNAALVEQAAAAAQSLQDQAQALEQTVGEFKLAAYSGSQAPAKKIQRQAPAESTEHQQQHDEIESVGEEWQEF